MLEAILPESQVQKIFHPNYLIVGIEIILALLTGFGLTAIGTGGGAWILGGIIGGAVVFYFYHSRYNEQAKPNKNSRKLGQIIVGLTIGFSIKNSNIATISPQLPTFVFLGFFLLLSGGIIGYIYSRVQKTDLLTATLATVPGNIGIMASMAADYGKNTSLVSLIQLIRFTAVIIVTPIIAHVSNPHNINATLHSLTDNLFTFNAQYLFLLILLTLVTSLIVNIGTKIKFPVAALFCPILVGIFFNSLVNLVPILPQTDFNLPPLVNLIGQALLGITIGEYWGINPRLEGGTLVRAVIPVALTFIAGFISAGIAMIVTPWDWLTCLLVTSPGGSPEMILIALALHRNVEIVTAGHLVRLMAINFSLPALVSLVSYLETNSQKSEARIERSAIISEQPDPRLL